MGMIGKWFGGMLTRAALACGLLVGTALVGLGASVELTTETGSCAGTITGNTVDYTVVYPANQTNLPVFFHQYGQISQANGVEDVNARVAGYGAFSVYVSLSDSHCGYALQDYKDAIDTVFKRYADKINTGNVTIAGESYAGGVCYGMSVRFPYLFDAVIPIYGVSDYGYDETESWYPLILRNSPNWSPISNMNANIGDRAAYRETRYLVRNAVFGAKNNRYAHYEILHDADDGVSKVGVQVQLSRRYVAEMDRLGYSNYRYTETPKEGFVYPKDTRFASSLWGQQIRYTHGFWNLNDTSLYEFELNTLKPNMLSGTWKRPAFATTGDLFIPSFLEVPYFRFDLGSIANNCDEAANVIYDVSSSDKYSFRLTPRTALTRGTLQLMKLMPNNAYEVTCILADTDTVLSVSALEADVGGRLTCSIPNAVLGSTLVVECVRIIPEPGTMVTLVAGLLAVAAHACWRYGKQA